MNLDKTPIYKLLFFKFFVNYLFLISLYLILAGNSKKMDVIFIFVSILFMSLFLLISSFEMGLTFFEMIFGGFL